MYSAEQGDDPALEDLAWVGYHPRAMLPAVGGAALLTVLLHGARLALEDGLALAESIGEFTVYILNWAIWLGVAAVFLYRCITYTYRLTDRALLVDFGFTHPAIAPIPLCDVVGITTGSGTLGRWLGIGWVEVRTADRTIRLPGIRKPQLFAEKIRVAREAVREAVRSTTATG
jgi:membrane protein YdbS with pleckstrin-like domain